jgi:hypothetical protein
MPSVTGLVGGRKASTTKGTKPRQGSPTVLVVARKFFMTVAASPAGWSLARELPQAPWMDRLNPSAVAIRRFHRMIKGFETLENVSALPSHPIILDRPETAPGSAAMGPL